MNILKAKRILESEGIRLKRVDEKNTYDSAWEVGPVSDFDEEANSFRHSYWADNNVRPKVVRRAMWFRVAEYLVEHPDGETKGEIQRALGIKSDGWKDLFPYLQRYVRDGILEFDKETRKYSLTEEGEDRYHDTATRYVSDKAAAEAKFEKKYGKSYNAEAMRNNVLGRSRERVCYLIRGWERENGIDLPRPKEREIEHEIADRVTDPSTGELLDGWEDKAQTILDREYEDLYRSNRKKNVSDYFDKRRATTESINESFAKDPSSYLRRFAKIRERVVNRAAKIDPELMAHYNVTPLSRHLHPHYEGDYLDRLVYGYMNGRPGDTERMANELIIWMRKNA